MVETVDLKAVAILEMESDMRPVLVGKFVEGLMWTFMALLLAPDGFSAIVQR